MLLCHLTYAIKTHQGTQGPQLPPSATFLTDYFTSHTFELTNKFSRSESRWIWWHRSGQVRQTIRTFWLRGEFINPSTHPGLSPRQVLSGNKIFSVKFYEILKYFLKYSLNLCLIYLQDSDREGKVKGLGMASQNTCRTRVDHRRRHCDSWTCTERVYYGWRHRL